MATAFLDRVSNKAIGQMLVEKGTVTEQQLDEALAAGKRDGVRVGEALVRLGYVSREALGYVLGEQYGVRPMELHPSMLDERLIRRFPLEILQRYQVLPLIEVGDELVVVVSDPNDTAGLHELSAMAPAYTISPQLAEPGQVRRCLESLADRLPRSSGQSSPLTVPAECRLDPVIPQPNDPNFANWLIATTLQQPEADLLIRPAGNECQVARRTPSGSGQALEQIHHFPGELFNAVRDALLRNCITLEHTNERAGVWSAPMRYAGRTFDLTVTTLSSQRTPVIRIRALEHIADDAGITQVLELPAIETGRCYIILYTSRESLETGIAELLLQLAGTHVILMFQDATRRAFENVQSLPAGISNVSDAVRASGATCVLFDSPPSPAEVYRLLRMGTEPPAVIVCAPVADGEAPDISPDVEELRRRTPCVIVPLNATGQLTIRRPTDNSGEEGAN